MPLATPSSWHSQNSMLSEGGPCWFKLSRHITILVRGIRTHLQKLYVTTGGKEDVDLQIVEVICTGAKCLLIPSILVLIICDTLQYLPWCYLHMFLNQRPICPVFLMLIEALICTSKELGIGTPTSISKG